MGLQFLNSLYIPQEYGPDPKTGKKGILAPDAVIRKIKNTVTGETTLEFEKQPKIPFWVATKGRGYPELFVKKSEAREVIIPYADRKKELARELGKLQDFYNAASNGSMYEFNKEVLRSDQLYLADVNIEDYQKTIFTLQNGRVFGKVKTAFMDIEVDIRHYDKFPDADVAPCKINLINYMYVPTKEMYSFILRDPTIPAIAEIESDLPGFVVSLEDEIPTSEGIKYNFIFCDDEKTLIREFFRVVHKTKPDFCGIWNMNFDIKTILNRMNRLGMDKFDVICHPDVPLAFRYVKYDEEKNGSGDEAGHPSRLWHWFETSDYTQFYDQMSLYSNMRKRSLLPSYKLDDIGHNEVGVKKVDLEGQGYTIKTVIDGNFRLFLKYGIKDVFTQFKIEEKVSDLDQFIIFTGNARLSKGTKVSVVIKSLLMLEFFERDWIIGNNVDYQIKESVSGAIVADINNMEQKGIDLMGAPSLLFKAVVDFDAASQYPSMMIAFNISKSTIHGRVFQVVDENGKILSSGEDINSLLQTRDLGIFDIGSQYFGLPEIQDVIASFAKEQKHA